MVPRRAASQLVFIVLLPCCYGMAASPEHSERSYKPIARREPLQAGNHDLSAEATWPFKPEHVALSPTGEMIAVKAARTAHKAHHGTAPTTVSESTGLAAAVNAIESGFNTSAYCGQDFRFGVSNKTNCTNTVDDALILDPDDCYAAAAQAGVTANKSTFYVDSTYFQITPKGCFAHPCAEDAHGVCYYYNGVGDWPDVTDPRFTGRPVCHRQKWLNGTVLTGSPLEGDDPVGCPTGYSGITHNETCMAMDSCKSYGQGTDFRIATTNSSQYDEYPLGCFINTGTGKDGKVYFNPPKVDAADSTKIILPLRPKGTPVCNVSSEMHFPEFGGLWDALP